MPPLRSSAPLVSCVAFLAACAATPRPWDGVGVERTLAIGARLPAATHYEIEGDFFGVDLATDTPVTANDTGRLEGRAGGAVRVERFFGPDWSAAALAELRLFDVKNLAPFGSDLPLTVETIDAWQFALQVKRHFAAHPDHPRYRPWIGFELQYLPDVSGDVVLDLSGFGSSNLEIESRGEPFLVGALQVGVTAHVTERLLFDIGLAYEHALTPLDADLSFEIAGETVPITAEYEPRGFLLGWGLSWLL